MFPAVPPLLRAVVRRCLYRGPCLALLMLVAIAFIFHRVHNQSVREVREPTVEKPDPGQYPGYREHEQQEPGKMLPVSGPRHPTTSLTRTFIPGVPKAPDEKYTKALVMAKMMREDVSWIHEPFQYSDDEVKGPLSVSDEWDLFVYTTDNTAEQFHTPINKGREVMAYLTYIVDNYERLPDVSVFMHAHRSSWHDNFFDLNAPAMLRRLNLDRVARLGYANLRCQWEPGCPDWMRPFEIDPDGQKPEQAAFAQAWRELFPLAGEVPQVLAQPCCAQFALTADRIRALPLAQYVVLRDWMLTTELEDSISGRVFEYVYQYLWTGQEVLCPAEHDCYCEGYGICFESGKRGFDAFVKRKFKRVWFAKAIDKVNGMVHDMFGIGGAEEPLEEPTFVFWDVERRRSKQSRSVGQARSANNSQSRDAAQGDTSGKDAQTHGRVEGLGNPNQTKPDTGQP